MKFFSIFFYIWLLFLLFNIYGYFELWWFDNMYKYFNQKWLEYWFYNKDTPEFDIYFHFYLYIFFSIFFSAWGWIMSWIIKMVYQIPIMIIIFIWVWYHIETIRVWFYTSWIILSVIFLFMISSIPFYREQISFFKKLKQKRNESFKLRAIESIWTFSHISTDYSIRINKIYWKRAIYKVIHPLTWLETEVKTPIFFHKNIPNTPINLVIYFDRDNTEKYLCEL